MICKSGYRVVSSSISNKCCGITISIHDSFKVNKLITDDTGRFVQALVDFSDNQLSFISLYAPNRNLEQNAFFASLTGLVILTRPVFVADDFNCVLDNLLDRKRCPSFAGGECSSAREWAGFAIFAFFYTDLFFVGYNASWSHCLFWAHASGTFVSRLDMIWAPTIYIDLITV